MLVSKDRASSSSSNYEYTKSDYCLCLAIHAPRKGIIEVLICFLVSYGLRILVNVNTQILNKAS